MSYDPNSSDSTFSRILTRLDEQDRNRAEAHLEALAVLNEIRAEAKKTNGRITDLERWRDIFKAKTALISTVVSTAIGVIGWLLNR